MSGSRPPLGGIRVVALEHAVSMPLATRYLADLGADVIKIERTDGGDFARYYDAHVRGQSTYFTWLNRGKRSLTLDLKDSRGREIAAHLACSADVFVQNLSPGTAERLGLGVRELMETNTRLIYCSLSGYGTSGSYAGHKAYDLLIQGEAGVISVSGTPEQPAKVGISVVDIAGGMHVLTGVLAALVERGATGVGKELQVTLLDAIGEWMQVPYLYSRYTGRPFPRSGIRHNMIAPYGPFACGERSSVNLAIQNEREWRRFCEHVLRESSISDDPRFADNEQRIANIDELTEEIEKRFRTLGAEEVSRRLEAAEIPSGKTRDAAQAAEHPQYRERGRWAEWDSPSGPISLLRFAIDAESWGEDRRPIPTVGQHTDEILAEAGLSGIEIEELRRAGVV